jgi:hypothetical protein
MHVLHPYLPRLPTASSLVVPLPLSQSGYGAAGDIAAYCTLERSWPPSVEAAAAAAAAEGEQRAQALRSQWEGAEGGGAPEGSGEEVAGPFTTLIASIQHQLGAVLRQWAAENGWGETASLGGGGSRGFGRGVSSGTGGAPLSGRSAGTSSTLGVTGATVRLSAGRTRPGSSAGTGRGGWAAGGSGRAAASLLRGSSAQGSRPGSVGGKSADP